MLRLFVAWLCVFEFCFFFFKQKTAYEMRISDWSSDVCSSDLIGFMLSFPISDGLAAEIAQFITQCEFLVGIICREIERIDRVAQFALMPFRLRLIINIVEIGSFANPIAVAAENQPFVGIERSEEPTT